jgi:hypothetical protein
MMMMLDNEKERILLMYGMNHESYCWKSTVYSTVPRLFPSRIVRDNDITIIADGYTVPYIYRERYKGTSGQSTALGFVY